MKSIGSILKEVLITEAKQMPYTVSPDGQVKISLDFKLKKRTFNVDLYDPNHPKGYKLTPEQQLEWYFDTQEMLTVKDFKYDKKTNTVTINTKKPDKADESPKVEVDEFVNGLKRHITSDTTWRPAPRMLEKGW